MDTGTSAGERPIAHLRNLVGNTPLIEVDATFRGRRARVFAKAEHLNMTGSIKDRMALHILERARERGLLVAGGCIAEATSGNTGISFAALGAALGHRVVIFMPDWMSKERIDLMRALGAEIRLVSAEDGGFAGCISGAEEFAAGTDGCFLPRQFENVDNVEAHELTTGPELWWQLRFEGLAPDAFIAGVGTGGTVVGAGRFLRSQRPSVRVHPLEPLDSPTLTTGYKCGSHRIQGISDEFVPPIVDLGELHSIVSVGDGDSIIMAQRLAAELGLAVGISSGANLLGALLVADELGDGAVVTTVFPDDNKKYLSTDLLREEPIAEGYHSSEVDLHGFRAIKRTCVTCCEGEECDRIHLLEGGVSEPHCALRASERRGA